MKKRTIYAIVTIMSVALLGLVIIQFIWIKWQVDLYSKNFDTKVVLALNTISFKLQEAEQSSLVNSKRNIKGLFGNQNQNLIDDVLATSGEKWRRYNLNYELSDLSKLADPHSALDNIDKNDLDTYIKQELEMKDIDLVYEYGVYSNKLKDFTIINGHFVAQVNDSQSSNGETNNLMENLAYEVPLFSGPENTPGSLKVFFPGKTSWLWSSVLPSLLASLFFTGLVLFCFVFTILIILKQKKVSEMKTDFINNMTHEFKTPIATISLASDSIKSPMISSNPEKVNRFADIIKQENSRMLNQVEKVLQMARMDKEEFELKITEVDMHQIIKQAAEHTQLKVVKRNGSVKTDFNAKDYQIEGDKTHLSNIIHNLLDNAEKYSAEAPQITIETRSKKDGFSVSIKDNGIGMTNESLKNIFDKFFRVHTGNRHDVKGFGLGLSYVKSLVDAHQGTISVKSELGKGSVFTIFFPFKFNK